MNVLSTFSSVGIGETLIHEKYPQFHYTAIEIVPKLCEEYKLRFPDSEVICGDAYEYIYTHAGEYDIITGTPACQTYSRLTHYGGKQLTPDDRIFQLIDFLKNNFNGKWFVENVRSPYLIQNSSMKPVQIERHLFWSNVALHNHLKYPVPWFRFDKSTEGQNGLSGVETYIQNMQAFLGVKLSKRFYIRGNHCPGQIYREGLHPLIGLFVFEQLLHPSIQSRLPGTLK